ncbi:hypothetical protein PVK06_036554 [Gossypium arboreum]|uniref:Uncharacterized protein n=1 Tax=Gossypium arboreum TaxID=29729 RepID=A0ABR0NJU6_GOSAR|nr:hypothetical protein PVK06_036554 [Gossypium arboreum]
MKIETNLNKLKPIHQLLPLQGQGFQGISKKGFQRRYRQMPVAGAGGGRQIHQWVNQVVNGRCTSAWSRL